MRLLRLLLLLHLSLLPSVAPVAVVGVLEISQIILELSKTLFEAFQVVNDSSDLIETYDTRREKLVFTKLDMINVQVSELTQRLNTIDQNIDTITRLLNDLPYELRLELDLSAIRTRLHFLDIYYNKMQNYVMDFDEYENSTLIEFGNSVLSSHPNSVHHMIEFIHRQVTSKEFLEMMSKRFTPQPGSAFCNEHQSSQQMFINLLKQMMVTNMKSHLLMQTSYMIKKLYGQDHFTREIADSNRQFQSRIRSLIIATKSYVAKASTALWACDPKEHVEGETYLEVTNFLHGYILNKANLDPRGKCRDECDTYTFLTKLTNCNGNNWCREQITCSKILNCQYTDSSLQVCKANLVKENRRYSYVEYENGRTLGRKQNCTNKDKRHLETYRDYLIWKCSNCFCICEEKETAYSNRYISLRSVMANLTDNRVVTGIRFVRHNRIIHLQIQEGKLIEYGKIDPDTVRWVPVENYKITDRKIYPGQDYYTINWDQRSIELTDIMLGAKRVVTGARFRKIGGRLHLEVLSTPFNITTGQLVKSRSFFEDDPRIQLKHKFGKLLHLTKPDIPTRSTITSNVFTTDKHVDFTHTDYDKDAAQTTVPFFDAQPVTSAIPTPLSGLGIFHKGHTGSGGFLAPRIFTFNFTEQLQPELFGQTNN